MKTTPKYTDTKTTDDKEMRVLTAYFKKIALISYPSELQMTREILLSILVGHFWGKYC